MHGVRGASGDVRALGPCLSLPRATRDRSFLFKLEDGVTVGGGGLIAEWLSSPPRLPPRPHLFYAPVEAPLGDLEGEARQG